MRYTPISSKLFCGNRERLKSCLKPNSMVVIHSADHLPLSADAFASYRQHSNFFYLSGINQADSVLIMAPDFPDKNLREILFVKETNETIVTWEGEKLGLTEAVKLSGIKKTLWLNQFELVFNSMIKKIDNLYVDINENSKPELSHHLANERFSRVCESKYPLVKVEKLNTAFIGLRMFKSTFELHAIREAAAITAEGYERVMKFLRPGINEYEIEAEFIHEFVSRKSDGFAYGPIIASAASACILHYEANDKLCKDGDLVLMDVAARYANYNADVTRTLPVNGRFSARQREIYGAVLRVKKQAEELLRPGMILKDFNQKVGLLMEAELIKLGLILKQEVDRQNPEKPVYKKYFMHSISHHLGLDVHDTANYQQPMAEGMVLTVEPGIYIKEEGIGIRLEDDIFIGEEENINLTSSIPIEIDEIEQIMKS